MRRVRVCSVIYVYIQMLQIARRSSCKRSYTRVNLEGITILSMDFLCNKSQHIERIGGRGQLVKMIQANLGPLFSPPPPPLMLSTVLQKHSYIQLYLYSMRVHAVLNNDARLHHLYILHPIVYFLYMYILEIYWYEW